MNVGAFLTSVKAQLCGPEDPGHDSHEEVEAMRDVEAYARSTGGLGGGGTVVQAYGDTKNEITVWLNPHYNDPIIVTVKTGRTVWAHADSFDEKVTDSWKRLDDPEEQHWASHKHAVAVDTIIRRHFAAQLSGGTPRHSKH
jgi:hypothetical protein